MKHEPKAVKEARRAIACLAIAVDAEVYEDIKAKLDAAIDTLTRHREECREHGSFIGAEGGAVTCPWCRVAALTSQLEEWEKRRQSWEAALKDADQQLASAKAEGERPKIVTLCGSSRFCDIMAVCAWFIERDENAIAMDLHLLPSWYTTAGSHLAEHEGCADQMDALHLRKIDLSDEIFVVNVNDYIGDSTRREVEYAKKAGKPIRWFTHDAIGTAVSEHYVANNPPDAVVVEGEITEITGQESPYEILIAVCVTESAGIDSGDKVTITKKGGTDV